ncbi:odorant receptor 63a-like [Ctenocephalides felis]|uniref:odorant receptor 63a-like n=1 Tax=Ctenocephalides felis TaxID=7515 RepID=UPI000E6E52E5|nr:odorant receptor 63a-like [Ctenocephalides felis]
MVHDHLIQRSGVNNWTSKHDRKSNLDRMWLIKWSMRLTGIWPYDLVGKYSTMWFMFTCLNWFSLVWMGFAMCSFMYRYMNDIIVVIDTICTYSTNVICMVKMTWIIYKRQLFHELIDIVLSNRLLEINPLLEWNRGIPSSYAQKLQKFTIKIFDKNWKEYRIVSRIFCTMVIVTALSYASIPLIIMAYMKFTSGIVPRHHIYNADYSVLSIEVSQTPFYETSLTHETFVGLIIYSVVVGLDVIYCFFTMYLRDQLRILQQMLKMIDEEIDEPFKQKKIIECADERLMKCVRHHTTIISFQNKLEVAYGPVTLFQTVLSSILICVIAFRSSISTTDLTNLLIKIPYLLAAIVQLLLYSYYGQAVINESTELATSLYETHWYEYSKSFRSSLLIIFPQIQRPLHLSGMGFIVMSLDSFKAV